MRRKVLVYRSDWGRVSEGFVRDHAPNLLRYDAITVALSGGGSGPKVAPPDYWVCGSRKPNAVLRYAYRLFGNSANLDELLAREKPDIIHAHFATDAVDMLPFAQRHKIPLIVTLHGYDVRIANNKARHIWKDRANWIIKRKKLFEYAHLFLPVSEYVSNEAVENGFPPSKMKRHYLGTDVASVSQEVFSRQERAGIVYVGRLIESKGLRHLLHAMAIVEAKIGKHTLQIIGDGPERESFENEAKRLNIDCAFLGALPREEALKHMSRALVFSMPSSLESFGLVYLEAQLGGAPVVAYACGGACEAVLHGETGILTPEGDVDALALSIEKLICDHEYWSVMANNARQHVLENFDIAKKSEELEVIYDELLGRIN